MEEVPLSHVTEGHSITVLQVEPPVLSVKSLRRPGDSGALLGALQPRRICDLRLLPAPSERRDSSSCRICGSTWAFPVLNVHLRLPESRSLR